MSLGTGGAHSVQDALKISRVVGLSIRLHPRVAGSSPLQLPIAASLFLYFLQLPPLWEFALPTTLYSSFSLLLVICNCCSIGAMFTLLGRSLRSYNLSTLGQI